MDDVAAVAPLVARNQPDGRGQNVGSRGALPHASAAPELLSDGAKDERAEREAEAGGPHANTKRDDGHADDEGARHRDQERIAKVDERRLTPRGERAISRQEQEQEADRQHPLVEERRTHGQAFARHRLAQRREHRREEHEQRPEQENPVIDEERGFAGRPGLKIVAGTQQRQPVDYEPEADREDRDHEAGE